MRGSNKNHKELTESGEEGEELTFLLTQRTNMTKDKEEMHTRTNKDDMRSERKKRELCQQLL